MQQIYLILIGQSQHGAIGCWSLPYTVLLALHVDLPDGGVICSEWGRNWCLAQWWVKRSPTYSTGWWWWAARCGRMVQSAGQNSFSPAWPCCWETTRAPLGWWWSSCRTVRPSRSSPAPRWPGSQLRAAAHTMSPSCWREHGAHSQTARPSSRSKLLHLRIRMIFSEDCRKCVFCGEVIILVFLILFVLFCWMLKGDFEMYQIMCIKKLNCNNNNKD